jgi:hypothetical protein
MQGVEPAGSDHSAAARESDVDLVRAVEQLSSQVDNLLAVRPPDASLHADQGAAHASLHADHGAAEERAELGSASEDWLSTHNPGTAASLHRTAMRRASTMHGSGRLSIGLPESDGRATGEGSPEVTSASGGHGTPDSHGSPLHRFLKASDKAGIPPISLRGRLIKSVDAALAENLGKYAKHGQKSVPLIFADSLIHKLRRVTGQCNLVDSAHSVDVKIGNHTRRLLEHMTTSQRVAGISSSDTGFPNLKKAANKRLGQLFSSFNTGSAEPSANFPAPVSTNEGSPAPEWGRNMRQRIQSLIPRVSSDAASDAEDAMEPKVDDEATAEQICERLFAGDEANPAEPVHSIACIVSKAESYHPQFTFLDQKHQNLQDDAGEKVLLPLPHCPNADPQLTCCPARVAQRVAVG